MLQKYFGAILLTSLMFVPQLAKAQQYNFISIDVLGNTTRTVVNGINLNLNKASASMLVGEFDDDAGNTHGFLLSNDAFTQIDYTPKQADQAATTANGVNDHGEIAGTLTRTNGQVTGFFRNAQGIFTDIIAPDSVLTRPFSLNNNGDVVGQYRSNDSSQTRHAFIWNNGTFSTITPPGASGTTAIGINDSGHVVGTFVNASGRHGFLLINGVYTTIDVPGANFTVCEGINNNDQVAGLYEDAKKQLRGFLYNVLDRSFTLIDVPSKMNTQIFSINDQGQIVGEYDDKTSDSKLRTHGFVGTPAP